MYVLLLAVAPEHVDRVRNGDYTEKNLLNTNLVKDKSVHNIKNNSLSEGIDKTCSVLSQL